MINQEKFKPSQRQISHLKPGFRIIKPPIFIYFQPMNIPGG